MSASRAATPYEGEIVVASRPTKGAQLTQTAAASERKRLWLARAIVLVLLVATWEIASRTIISEFWISRPTKVLAVLMRWTSDQRPGETIANATLFFHLAITIQEAAYGFVVGSLTAIVDGVVLGQLQFL